MHDHVELVLGQEISCSDGPGGELRRVVVEPGGGRVTHLAVAAPGDPGGHLVPMHLVDLTGAAAVLSCTGAELHALESGQETWLLPGLASAQDMAWSGLGMGDNLGMGGSGLDPRDISAGPQRRTADRVPAGEVELTESEPVSGTESRRGRLHAVVVDPDNRITHLVLDQGHSWHHGRSTVPIDAVLSLDGSPPWT